MVQIVGMFDFGLKLSYEILLSFKISGTKECYYCNEINGFCR